MGTAGVFRVVWRNRSLRRVLTAFLLFNAQEYGVWIAVTLYAYEQGGPTTAGAVLVAQLVPSALVAPFASVLGDRMRRDRALVLGYALQACTLALLAVAFWLAPPLLAYGSAILASCAVTLTRPVHNAILPGLSDSPEELTAANSLSGTAEGLGILIGPAANSVLIVIGGPELVAGVFALVMVGVSGLALRLRSMVGVAAREPSAGGVVRAAAEGARELRRDMPAAVLTVLGGSQFVVLGMFDVFFAVLAIDVLRIGEEGVGVLAAAAGLGGMIGAAGTAVLVGRTRLNPALQLGLVVTGVGLALVALPDSIGPMIGLVALAGAGRSFFDVAARTLLQRSVKDEVLARVFGLQEALLMIGLAVGAALAPVFVGTFGRRGSLVAAGVLLPLAGLSCLPSLRSLDRRSVKPDPKRTALLRSIPIFEPLPQPVLERLSWNLIALEFPAGAVFIREGDPGDRFYVIVDGEVSVASAGRELRRQGPGSYVGEIALLRDVPRTATVTAATDVRLLALEREEFLAAVTGSPRSTHVANTEAERRLAGSGES